MWGGIRLSCNFLELKPDLVFNMNLGFPFTLQFEAGGLQMTCWACCIIEVLS